MLWIVMTLAVAQPVEFNGRLSQTVVFEGRLSEKGGDPARLRGDDATIPPGHDAPAPQRLGSPAELADNRDAPVPIAPAAERQASPPAASTAVCQCRGYNEAVCFCLRAGLKCHCSKDVGSEWRVEGGKAVAKTGRKVNPNQAAFDAEWDRRVSARGGTSGPGKAAGVGPGNRLNPAQATAGTGGTRSASVGPTAQTGPGDASGPGKAAREPESARQDAQAAPEPPLEVASAQGTELWFYTQRSCVPCRALEPILKRLEADGLTVHRIDCSRGAPTRRVAGKDVAVSVTPTIVIGRDSKWVATLQGPVSESRLLSALGL